VLEALRVNDLLARYGGEEFILLLPDSDGSAALEVIDRLRTATPLAQTFSAGIACWDGVEAAPVLVARADDALYVAKRRGRNCAALAPYGAGGDPDTTDVAGVRAPAAALSYAPPGS
jgi:diguanylate cyclase (GGDEF)-like protein